jgi:hypothetical protein
MSHQWSTIAHCGFEQVLNRQLPMRQNSAPPFAATDLGYRSSFERLRGDQQWHDPTNYGTSHRFQASRELRCAIAITSQRLLPLLASTKRPPG